MTRSIWKSPFIDNFLLKNKKNKKIWTRRSEIISLFKGNTYFIYNGHKFMKILVSDKMIGHKFGEFVSTRQKPKHKKK